MNAITNAMITHVFILLFLVGAFIAWCIWGYFSSNVEQAAYSVINWTTAIIFYLIFIVGLVVFVIAPAKD